MASNYGTVNTWLQLLEDKSSGKEDDLRKQMQDQDEQWRQMERRLHVQRKSPAPPEVDAVSTAAGDSISWHVLNELSSLKDVVQQVINLEKDRVNMRFLERLESLETMSHTHESRISLVEQQLSSLMSNKQNISITTSASENQPAIVELEDRLSTLESQPSFDLRLHLIEDKLSEVSKITAIEERLKVITEQQVQATSDAQIALSQVSLILPKSNPSVPSAAITVPQQVINPPRDHRGTPISNVSNKHTVQIDDSSRLNNISAAFTSSTMPTTPFPSPAKIDSQIQQNNQIQHQPQLQPRFSIPGSSSRGSQSSR